MTRLQTASVSLIVLSAALVHCGHGASSTPPTASPGPEPMSATAPPSQSDKEPMTPASGTVERPSEQTSPSAAPTEAAPVAAPLSDAQIVKVIDLANGAEVDQAKIAQGKAKNAKVQKFAAMMVSDHGKARVKGNKLATKLNLKAEDSTVASELKTDADTMLSSLKSAARADFDQAYMAAQVDAHRKVLSALTDKLIPNAKDSELKALLEEMRSTVEAHLSQAQEIQNELGPAAGDLPGSAAK
jgi:putative membrane protein